MTHNVIRQLGNRRRIFGGWEQRDRIILNEKELAGYVLVRRKNGVTTQSTHFGPRSIPGYDWIWLAKRNGRNGLKLPEGYVAPVEVGSEPVPVQTEAA